MENPSLVPCASALSATQNILRPETPEERDLIARLTEEMVRRWGGGEQVLAEEFLERHPRLWQCPVLAIDLVYEEICLRRERGQFDGLEVVLSRFPQWRTQLELMLECHRLLESGAPSFPEIGETVVGYRLLKSLGRGASGRVFLASQSDLGGRPVVLKLSSREGNEHLNLARLQHTHIVPLYAAQYEPDRNLRILCMPYFGGVTLEQFLLALCACPIEQRHGATLLEVLQASGVQPTGPAQPTLTRLAYVQALCWIGSCLADALYYAHECGLVHLDVKPANILIAADGQPMLLDFHLARGPLRPGSPLPDGLGGTPAYMAPEQAQAMQALSRGEAITHTVDARADIYSLGAVLYEALGGTLPFKPGQSPSLAKVNPRVSLGLSDIVDRCLRIDPNRRYANAELLARDLRSHLSHQPLEGVPNRSWKERWQKWHRRRPTALRSLGLLLLVVGTLAALTRGSITHWQHVHGDVEYALAEGRKNRERGRLAEALDQLQQGVALGHTLPFESHNLAELAKEIRAVEEAQIKESQRNLVRELHDLAEKVRALFLQDLGKLEGGAALERTCSELWGKRAQVKQWLGRTPTSEAMEDLLDVVLFTTDLRVHLAGPESKEPAHREALLVLEEAEGLFGANSTLDLAIRRHRQGGNQSVPPEHLRRLPRTPWEFSSLGRAALLANDLKTAADYLRQAVRLQPHGFWPNFYQGQCAYRLGQPAEAAAAFSVCIGANPTVASLFHNRALCYSALGRGDLALADYDCALKLDPSLAGAARNRGLLHLELSK